MGAKVNLIGRRFGRLVVLAEMSERGSWGKIMWECLCDCGGANILATTTLNSGLVKSCGCIKRELDLERTRTHGMSKTLIYDVYNSMKARCYNTANAAYSYYGGSGVKVCDRWLEGNGVGFLNFVEDMGEKPSPTFSVDRIDPDGDYSPGNCRWASKHTQAVNQRLKESNKSGKTGVAWDTKGKAWRAYISVEGKRVFLGTFHDKEEAIVARQNAELEHYGFVKE